MKDTDDILWQVIPVILMLFSIIVIVAKLYQGTFAFTLSFISGDISLACDILSVIIFTYLIFYPRKLVVYTYLFSVQGSLNIINGNTLIGSMLFVLAGAFLFRSGRITTLRSKKIFLILCALALSVASQLRNGITPFVDSVLDVLYLAAFMAILFLLLRPYYGRLTGKEGKTVADLTGLGLSQRDCDFIRSALDSETYQSIAARHGLSVSSVKQNMSAIYRKLGVPCKDAFLVRYSKACIKYPDFYQRTDYNPGSEPQDDDFPANRTADDYADGKTNMRVAIQGRY